MNSVLVDASSQKVSEEIELEFSTYLDDSEEWEAIFCGNQEGRVGLEQIQGWRYRAFGRVVSINPVVVDCSFFQVEDVECSSDPRLIGEPVTFIISRLGGRTV